MNSIKDSRMGSDQSLASFTLVDKCACGKTLLDPSHTCPDIVEVEE